MNLTAFSLNNKQFTLLAIIAVFFAGLAAYNVIPQAQDPGFPIRAAQITTFFPGASPQRVEELVTDQLEKAIQEMPELDSVTSQSKAGVSIITVNIKDQYKELRPIWDSLRRKIDGVQNSLPADAQASIINDEFGDVYGIVISIVGDGFNYAQLKETADEVRDEFLRLPLVSKVDIYGAQQEQIFINYDNSQLSKLGISPKYLADFLTNKNIILSGGEFQTQQEIINIEPSGNLESVAALRRTYVPIPGSEDVLPLGNIANISRDYITPQKSVVHSNGKNALTLAVAMIEGGNIVELGAQATSLLNDLQEVYPWGLSFDIVAFQPTLVEKTVNTFIDNLLQAIFVVTAVMLLTLGLRTGLIVASLIPVTIATSIAVMYNLDIGLDQVSLAALMIALGMLVDNSIVMAESIMTRMESGEPSSEAALGAANELKVPLLISSLTTAAAFLPIYLAESTTGEYTAPIFEVVSITLLASWLFSLTMIPLFCVMFLKLNIKPKQSIKSKQSATDETPGFMQKIEIKYRAVLEGLLTYRYLSIAVIVGIFFLSIYSFRFIPTIFFPPSEDPTFKLEVKLPIGTPISRTIDVVSDIEIYLTQLKNEAIAVANKQSQDGDIPAMPEGLIGWNVFIGNGGPRYVLSHTSEPASPNYAFFVLNTSSGIVIDNLMAKLDAHLFESFPDVSFSIKKLANGAAISNPIEVRISGKNQETLYSLATSVKQKMAEINGIKGITDDWGRQTKKLLINIDEAQAQRIGISNSDVARTLQASTSGLQIAEYRENEDIIPIIMRANSLSPDTADIPTSVDILTNDSQAFPMGQIASTDIEWEAAVIYRRDRMKTITVASGLENNVTANEINTLLKPWLIEEQKKWPTGYRWEFGGEAETAGGANASIFEQLPTAVVIIILLLMGQFNCFRKTSIILLTIPLGLIGVAFGLHVAGSYMGFMTLLGIVSLAGIVINNAIVLIDRIQIELDSGLAAYEAIGSAAQKRLRPILLTTLTTVVGMIPLWIGGGVMWEPMAVAIIFGLMGATVLTLGVVPVLYAILFRINKA